jgi:hypothetical protein
LLGIYFQKKHEGIPQIPLRYASLVAVTLSLPQLASTPLATTASMHLDL